MSAWKTTVGTVRKHWLIILAVLINLAIAGPLAADWTNDVCLVNNLWVECCVDCMFFCTCGDAPAP